MSIVFNHHALRCLAACGVAVVCLLALSACEFDQAIDDPDGPDKVTLIDVAPPEQREQGQAVQSVETITRTDPRDTDAAPVGPERYAITVTRIVFDRPAPRLTLALNTLGPADLDSLAAARWIDNGFGFGQIERSRLALFLANMPKSHGTNRVRHSSPINDTPAVLIDRISGRQRIDFVDPDGKPAPVALTRGKMQMLLRLVADKPAEAVADDDTASPGVRLVMVPHHFKPKMTLLPRSPLEKVYDGRVFSELKLDEPAPTDVAWVIWADLPAPPEPESDVVARPEGLEKLLEPIDVDPDAAPLDPKPEPPAPPAQRERDIFAPAEPESVSLAEAMLTGRRGRHAAQMILVIHVDRIDR